MNTTDAVENIPIFPLANEYETDNGWTYSIDFLRSIQCAAKTHGSHLEIEDIESILTVIESHVYLEIIKKNAKDNQ